MTLFINVGSYRSILFFGTNRFRGLMNDPNYFSILQLLGLSIIVNDENIKTPRKSIYILLIIFSIMMSNSKTGFLSLIILGVILVTNRVIKLEKHKRVYIVLSLPVIFLLGYVFRNEIVYLIADLPAKYIPGYDRVAVLIKDFQEGVSGGGSARDKTISNALTLWKENPLFGVGIGSYSKIGKIYLGSGSIAHNTYLQLIVEWGTIMTTMFLGLISSLIIKTRKSELGK